MTWKAFVLHLVRLFCDETGTRTFTLAAFQVRFGPELAAFRPHNAHPADKVRQQLQGLRQSGLLHFVDGRGTYTMRGLEPLRDEVDDVSVVLAAPAGSVKREYLLEVYARDRGWVRRAKDAYGDLCLLPGCRDTFRKDNGERYIEVHHILPLCEGGTEELPNLAVVWAHHHKMAHFAMLSERRRVRDLLTQSTQERLSFVRPCPT